MVLKGLIFLTLATITVNCSKGDANTLTPEFDFSAVTPVAIVDQWKQELIDIAREARDKAYTPYSNYKVGAAVICEDGFAYRGCNVENASCGLTCCAERIAIFNAIAQGQKKIHVIAVVSRKGSVPCGACLQVMSEFNDDMGIILADQNGKYVEEFCLKDVLPKQFIDKDLK